LQADQIDLTEQTLPGAIGIGRGAAEFSELLQALGFFLINGSGIA
jgi:hypothetical protein